MREYGVENVRGGVHCSIDRDQIRYSPYKTETAEINWNRAREILHRPKGTPEELKELYKNLFTV